MKTCLLSIAACLFTATTLCQINFENGYFIENNGNRINCLIRNSDWKNNPDRFRYKLEENGEIHTAGIGDVQEFAISGVTVFKRFTVDIDRRSYLAGKLSTVREPKFNNEQLFLKLLVGGKADLYVYEDGNLVRYFYALENQQPEQLIYTKYKSPEQKILENFYYKSQLSSQLSCEQISSTDIDQTNYSENDLMAYFVKYNSCSGQDYAVFKEEIERELFHLRIRPGLGYSSLNVQYYLQNAPDTDYGSQLSFRIGAEMEMVLPFNNNKWALTFEPFYRSLKSENDNDTRAAYSSLVAAMGLRHYFFLGEESKIFINGNFGLDFPLNSEFRVATSSMPRNLEVPNKLLDNYWALGTGFNLNDKISVELRYMFNQDLLMQYEFWTAEYSSFSLILGYNIL